MITFKKKNINIHTCTRKTFTIPSHIQLLLYQFQSGYGRKSGPPGPIVLVTVVKIAY